MRRRLSTLALFVAVASCTKQEAKVDTTATTPVAPNVVTFTTKDFTFESPDTIPGGLTTLVLKNSGPTLHHVQLVRLEQGKTYTDFVDGLKTMKASDGMPPWVVLVGGVNSPAPGAESSAMVTLQPGNYAVICLIDTPDKIPHFAKGMTKALAVTAAPAVGAADPQPDVMLTLKDYSFVFSTPLTAGHHVIKVDNAATQPHEVFLIKLAPGKTAEDLGKWAATYKGDPPGTPMGGTPALSQGNAQYVLVDLTPGNYLALCFISDAKDGKPHVDHGMILPFTIS